MNGLIKYSIVGITVGLWTLVLSSTAFAQISGTEHDFSGQGWSGGEICKVCHTPHNGDTTVTNAPLWNHEVTGSAFTLYSGLGTLNAVVGQPDSASKLCLSCHDGTVAIDSFGGAGGGSFIVGTPNLTTDLSNDHPISFTYDAALATADGELFDPTAKASGLGDTIHEDLLLGGQMECSSCHDPHDDTNQPFLVVSNASSVLCLTCHDK